jgi:glycine/serine hydroxymethyltransferase
MSDPSPVPSLQQAVGRALAALERQQQRGRRTLTLIPSENSLSVLARLPMLTDAYHRYFFNDTGEAGWAYPAGQEASVVETELTLPLLRELAGARHVNVRPLSGLHAMTLVLAAIGGPPGTPVLTVHPDQGGHYATADLARRLGLRPIPVTGPDPHTLDMEALARLVTRHRPALVYLDQSHGLFPFDASAVAAAVRAAGTGTRVHVDASHVMGLVFGGALPNPLIAGADSFGGSTHKSFPGPQKAIIATSSQAVADAVRATQPTFVSSHHLAATCSLGLAAAEFLACGGQEYARAVVAAARALGHGLHEQGLSPEGAGRGYTATHQLWVRTSPAGVDANTAAERLYEAGIAVNVLPDLPRLGEPALRLGVAEAVWHGLDVADMREVSEMISDAVFARQPAARIAGRVAALRAGHTSPYQMPLAGERAAALRRLLAALVPPDLAAAADGSEPPLLKESVPS